MKTFFSYSRITIAVGLAVMLAGPSVALAATAPSLGTAASFSTLAATSMSAAGAGTTVSGDSGLSPGLAVSRTGPWTVGGTEYFGAVGSSQTAQNDALLSPTSAFNVLAGEASSGAWSLNPAPIPGVWTAASSAVFAGPTLTLTGGPSDVWVFQIGQDLTFTGNVVLVGGAQACNVFWQVGRDATIAAGSQFIGTLIAARDVTVASGATVDGRIISGRDLTTDGNAITGPSCVVPPPPPSHGGQAPYPPPIFPLINIEKVPSPLSLPSGSGSVTYTYTVTNVGPVLMTNVTVKDDKCDTVQLKSGDVNNDSALDLTETWIYQCTKTVTETETNTATACGSSSSPQSSGRVCDTSSATVAVGIPLVPPLIHLVKTPSVFSLPVGGGAVTYSYAVTNPGTEPLHDVSITDNKCTGLPGRVTGHPGDLNHDNLLDPNETWQFTCQTNITQTTTNIGTAQGSANGFTVTDFSPSTVVVAVPALPQTGAPNDMTTTWLLLVVSSFASGVVVMHLMGRQRSVSTTV